MKLAKLFSGALLLTALFATTPAFAENPASAADKPDPKQIEAILVPDKTAILPGEPIYATFVIKNKSNADLPTYIEYLRDESVAHWNRYREVNLTVTGEDGHDIPANIIVNDPMMGGSYFGPLLQKITATGSVTHRLFVPWRFERPGTYTLTARRTLWFSEAEYMNARSGKASASLPVLATATIKVLQPDTAKMDSVIDDLLKTASNGMDFDLNESDDKLLALHDGRVIPYLWRLYESGHGEWQFMAMRSLQDFDMDEILNRVKKAMDTATGAPAKSPDDNRRRAVETQLQASNPRWLESLIALRHDPGVAVRQCVVRILATKVPPGLAIPVLQEMADDNNKTVATLAQWYLMMKNQSHAARNTQPGP